MPDPSDLFAQYMTAALEGGDMEQEPDRPQPCTNKDVAVAFLNDLINPNREDFQ